MTKRRGATSDIGFIFKKINENKKRKEKKIRGLIGWIGHALLVQPSETARWFLFFYIFIYFLKHETIVRSSASSFGHSDSDPGRVLSYIHTLIRYFADTLQTNLWCKFNKNLNATSKRWWPYYVRQALIMSIKYRTFVWYHVTMIDKRSKHHIYDLSNHLITRWYGKCPSTN